MTQNAQDNRSKKRTEYKVSIFNPVARRVVHDDNYARLTNHDYIGSFGIIFIPNQPKTTKI